MKGSQDGGRTGSRRRRSGGLDEADRRMQAMCMDKRWGMPARTCSPRENGVPGAARDASDTVHVRLERASLICVGAGEGVQRRGSKVIGERCISETWEQTARLGREGHSFTCDAVS